MRHREGDPAVADPLLQRGPQPRLVGVVGGQAGVDLPPTAAAVLDREHDPGGAGLGCGGSGGRGGAAGETGGEAGGDGGEGRQGGEGGATHGAPPVGGGCCGWTGGRSSALRTATSRGCTSVRPHD
ncbi:MAG TPA: hypothetical protein EYQ83_11980, partial [Acidobacteria bacterium]|nr:hypothetical protein [Acidobacteriota bacterium]